MALARIDTLQENGLVCTEVDEVDANIRVVVGGYTHDISVFLFEGGAGDNDAFWAVRGVWRWGREAGDGGFAEEDQPVPSVSIGEGHVLGHFLFVGFGVILLRRGC